MWACTCCTKADQVGMLWQSETLALTTSTGEILYTIGNQVII